MTQLNPVVQKLAEQAKGFVDLNQHVGGDNGCMIYTYEGLNKFVELIVQECADIALKSGNIANKNIAAKIESERIYHKIKEHFGVEE